MSCVPKFFEGCSADMVTVTHSDMTRAEHCSSVAFENILSKACDRFLKFQPHVLLGHCVKKQSDHIKQHLKQMNFTTEEAGTPNI